MASRRQDFAQLRAVARITELQKTPERLQRVVERRVARLERNGAKHKIGGWRNTYGISHPDARARVRRLG